MNQDVVAILCIFAVLLALGALGAFYGAIPMLLGLGIAVAMAWLWSDRIISPWDES